MKLKKIVLSLVLAALVLSLGSVAWAAESEQGCFLRGQVTAIEGTTLTVKTPDGERQVTTSDETRFRIRGVENPTIADVKVGDYILAGGEPDSTGTFVAKAIPRLLCAIANPVLIRSACEKWAMASSSLSCRARALPRL